MSNELRVPPDRRCPFYHEEGHRYVGGVCAGCNAPRPGSPAAPAETAGKPNQSNKPAETPNVIRLRAKWDELRAKGLRDMKLGSPSVVGVPMEELAGELLSIIDAFERSDFVDISHKLVDQPLAPPAAERAQGTAEPPPQHVREAIEQAMLSPCQSKRGAVVFRGDTLDGSGHNDLVAPFACDGSDACKRTCRHSAIHAEQAAMIEARGYCHGAELLHVKVVGGSLVPSGGPSCVQCSKLAVEACISGVWLYHADGWKRYEAQEFHRLSVLASVPSPVSGKTAQPADYTQTEQECKGCYGPCGRCEELAPTSPDSLARVRALVEQWEAKLAELRKLANHHAKQGQWEWRESVDVEGGMLAERLNELRAALAAPKE